MFCGRQPAPNLSVRRVAGSPRPLVVLTGMVQHPSRSCQPGSLAINDRLRIAVFTTGRFHLLDLARELAARGHRVRFYTMVPPWRTRRFGLPAECHRWLLPAVAPQFVAARAARGTRWSVSAERALLEAYDRVGARSVSRCDLFVGISGACNRVGAAVRQRYGTRVWIERGSRHILSQKAILDAIPGADRVASYSVRREEADYAAADVVSVLSQHCAESFREYGFPSDRLVCTTPGVDLRMFPPTVAPPADPPTVVMAGVWSLQKGCDVLTAAWRMLPGVRLLHVGRVGDCPLPTDPGFEHRPAVDQTELAGVYAQAQVFALASRQEGLATVLPQALACGLRVVCTDRTGGADLVSFMSDPTAVRVVPTNDPVALADGLRAALADARADTGLRDRLGSGRVGLSWAAYAERYEANLLAKGVGRG